MRQLLLFAVLSVRLAAAEAVDLTKEYSLAELIDLAERHNPETRVAWEQAKARAAAVGVARSQLYPTVAAMAFFGFSRRGFFFDTFYRQDLGLFQPTVNLSYTLLDFGARRSAIDRAAAEAVAADFAFTDAHRQVVFRTAAAYYRLLDTVGQQDAAQATVENAKTVLEAVDSRLANGLATRPDLLEARAAAAQAQFELAAAEGAEQVARGELCQVLGLSPTLPLRVKALREVPLPERLESPVEEAIEQALKKRPDLLAQRARIRAADAEIRHARSAYFPTVRTGAEYGIQRAFGSQNLSPYATAYAPTYAAQVNFSWNLFDGGARKAELARARAERRAADEELRTRQDAVETEVWTAYTNTRTALRQQEAAAALLQAAAESYAAALEAYQYGVRNFIDVVSAQRNLARARTAQVSAQTLLLHSAADLAFRTGELVQSSPTSRP